MSLNIIKVSHQRFAQYDKAHFCVITKIVVWCPTRDHFMIS